VKSEAYGLQRIGEQRLAIGKVHVRSDITWIEETFNFAVLHFGDHNVNAGVQKFWGDEQTRIMQEEIKAAFAKGDLPEVIRLMDKHFGSHNYSLWHLFRDEQVKIFDQILKAQINEIDESLRRTYEHHAPAILVMRNLGLPLPDVLNAIGKFIVNTDLRKVLEAPELDLPGLKQVAEDAMKFYPDLNRFSLGFLAGKKITDLMEKLQKTPEDLSQMETLNKMLEVIGTLQLGPHLWKSQNTLLSISRSLYPQMKDRADKGDEAARRWVEQLEALEAHMYMRTH